MFRIHRDECVSCEICIPECRRGAIRLVGEKPVIDEATCDGCGECIEVCPVEAIVRVERDPGAAPGE